MPSRTSIHEPPPLARTTSRARPFAGAVCTAGFCPSRVEVRHALALGPAEAPGRDHECSDDRDAEQRQHGDPRLTRRPVSAAWLRRAPDANRDVVVADREARVVLVDERLAVEAERLRVRAQEAPHVGRRGKDLELLVLERAEVLRADLRALFELGEVEVLTGAGLAEAGTDVEHEGGIVEALPPSSVP